MNTKNKITKNNEIETYEAPDINTDVNIDIGNGMADEIIDVLEPVLEYIEEKVDNIEAERDELNNFAVEIRMLFHRLKNGTEDPEGVDVDEYIPNLEDFVHIDFFDNEAID